MFWRRPSLGVRPNCLMPTTVLSFLSLVVACASASVTDLLLSAGGSFCPPKVETLRENNIDEEDFKMIQANE
ncbi:hypothetical protein LINPERPRIM_LOCUS32992 [Linum perenne]